MKNLKSFTQFIKEGLSDIYMSAKDIPEGIKDWVKEYTGKNIQQYRLDQSGDKLYLKMPWHQADRVTYQFFKLTGNNAVPVGNPVSRSGMESDSQQGYIEGMKKEGQIDIPEGMIAVEYGTFPQRVIIHTGPNAKLMIPDNAKFEDLTDEELVILISAKGLKSPYRPKLPDEFYNKLISKGLLAKNRSITNEGRNLLTDAKIKEKLRTAVDNWNKKAKWGNHLSVNIF